MQKVLSLIDRSLTPVQTKNKYIKRIKVPLNTLDPELIYVYEVNMKEALTANSISAKLKQQHIRALN